MELPLEGAAASKTVDAISPASAKKAIGAAAQAVGKLKKSGVKSGPEWDAAMAALAAAKAVYEALPPPVVDPREAALKERIKACATAVGKLKKSGTKSGDEWDAANAALDAVKAEYAAAGFVKGGGSKKKKKAKGKGGGSQQAKKGGGGASKKAPKAKKAAPVSAEVSDGTELPSLDSQIVPVPELGTYYVTTAINYTNGPPHIGHAYEGVTADVIARYHRLFGRETFFLTGTDEHGLKIFQTAEKESAATGVTVRPIDICDRYAGMFQALNVRLLISNDFYVRTTQPKHEAMASEMFTRSIDNGDIFLGNYEGWYSVREERYIPEADAALADYKDEYGSPLEKKNESTYMFRASKYKQQLLDHIAANPGFIQPAKQRDNVLALLAKGCPDISVSRSKFDWGVTLPNDPAHVMYVWFDALTNYLSGIDYLAPGSANAKFWDGPTTHIIGKDIVRFHCITWPCILLSCGVSLPDCVFGHGFVNDESGQKMSKSVGNVIDPNIVLDSNPADSLRYYIVRACQYGDDLRFSSEAMHMMHNADLLKTYGNAVKRATSFAPKYTEGIVPTDEAEAYAADGSGAPFDLVALRDSVEAAMATYDLKGAIELAMAACREINGYMQRREPWKKKGDEFAAFRRVVVRTALEAIYVTTLLLAPAIPTLAARVLRALNAAPVAIASLHATATSGGLDNLVPGTALGPDILLVQEMGLPSAEEAAAAKKKKKGGGGGGGGKKKNKAAAVPPIEDLDIRVGRIVRAWPHPDSEKLWCEAIDVGDESGPRDIASGLRKFYPEQSQLEGRLVCVVCNLKPRPLAGFVSNGMVLCAKSADLASLDFVEPPAGATVGERVTFPGFPFSEVRTALHCHHTTTPHSPPSLTSPSLTLSPHAQVVPAKVLSANKSKKSWAAVKPLLKTNADKIACYSGSPFTTSAGPCAAATVADGIVE